MDVPEQVFFIFRAETAGEESGAPLGEAGGVPLCDTQGSVRHIRSSSECRDLANYISGESLIWSVSSFDPCQMQKYPDSARVYPDTFAFDQ